MREVAASKNLRDLACDNTLIFGSEAALHHHMNTELERRQRALAERGNILARLRWLITSAGQPERDLLGIFDQAIFVHRDRIGLAQETILARFTGAGGNLRGRDIFERQLKE